MIGHLYKIDESGIIIDVIVADSDFNPNDGGKWISSENWWYQPGININDPEPASYTVYDSKTNTYYDAKTKEPIVLDKTKTTGIKTA